MSGAQLSLGEHILVVANAFDSMVHPRPYLWHKAVSKAEALRALREGRGTAYDARVVDAWVSANLAGGEHVHASDHAD